MGEIARPVVRPFNPQNLSLPSRISAWFAPEDARGVQQEFFELGDVEDIELNITETFLEKKSARLGIFSTIRRLVSENAGEVTLAITEMVGRNLEIMFRSATIIDRNDTAGNSALVHEAARVRLTGTTASEFSQPAVEGDLGGTLSNRVVTLIEVTSTDGATRFVDGVDFTLVNAVPGTHSTATLTFAGFTAIATTTLTLTNPDTTTVVLTAGTDFVDGATAGSTAALAADVSRAINVNAGTNFTATVVGSVVTVSANALDGVDPPDIVATGATLIADVGAANSFAGAVATSAATLARIQLGAIPSGVEVRVVYTFTREACDYSFQDGIALQGALKVQILSNNGPQGFYEFFRTSLAMSGAVTINPQEFQKAALTATILDDGLGRRGRFVLFKKFRDFFVSPAGACI